MNYKSRNDSVLFFIAYQHRIEDCDAQVNKLKEEITNYEEQAAKLGRQYAINKDNIDR